MLKPDLCYGFGRLWGSPLQPCVSMSCQPRSLPESFYALPVIREHFQFRLFLELLHLNNIQISLPLTSCTSSLVLLSTSSPSSSHRSHPFSLALPASPNSATDHSDTLLFHHSTLTFRRSQPTSRSPLRPRSRTPRNGIHRVSGGCEPS